MRVGEVTKLALDRATPVRADTKVALAFQGLTGLADVSLVGGAPDAAPVVAGAADCRPSTPTQMPAPI